MARKRPAENETVAEAKKKFDEQTLARVLEAAYVLQEHQPELQQFKSGLDLMRKGPDTEQALTDAVPPIPIDIPAPPIPPPIASAAAASVAPISFPAPPAPPPVPAPEAVAARSDASILEQVMDTQRQVQAQKLDLDAAMSLVAGQVIEICGAAGAAIAIANRRIVSYRSVAGIRTLPAGSEVSADDALCARCLQSGAVMQCVDANSENLPQREECRHRGIGSLIAAPLFHEGRTVGALELLFSDPNAFTEQDVQTCQFMAGILTDSLSRDPGLRWKDAAVTDAAPIGEIVPTEDQTAGEVAKQDAAMEAAPSYQCSRCGQMLLAGEQFCGQCGVPRSGDYEPPSMQSKVASLWHMQETRKPEASSSVPVNEPPAELVPESAPLTLRASILNPLDRPKRTSVPHFGLQDGEGTNAKQPPAASIEPASGKPASEIDAPVPHANKALEELISTPPPVQANWSSATEARDFLEQIADGTPQNVLLRLWNTRRGDIYLAIAVILVVCVIRWGIWSSHPASPQPAPAPAPATPHKMAELDLPFSERMLITLGL
ncbi:MAG TPA: GAF domain-containing protein, partial [Candidatus Binatia bacterium]|nr:GAF domain-containing protein [Candidatus Binatia bacterium]